MRQLRPDGRPYRPASPLRNSRVTSSSAAIVSASHSTSLTPRQIELLGMARPENDGRHEGIGRQPAYREGGHCCPALTGDGLDPLDRRELAIVPIARLIDLSERPVSG